jgi:hypothetical protein
MTTLVFPPLTWHILQIIVDVVSFVTFISVLNQSKGHWVLSDVLYSTISTCLKLKEEFEMSSSFDFMQEKSIIILELGFLAFIIQKEVCVVFKFNFFLKNYEQKKAHNIFFFNVGS